MDWETRGVSRLQRGSPNPAQKNLFSQRIISIVHPQTTNPRLKMHLSAMRIQNKLLKHNSKKSQNEIKFMPKTGIMTEDRKRKPKKLTFTSTLISNQSNNLRYSKSSKIPSNGKDSSLNWPKAASIPILDFCGAQRSAG
jgi:hypothetical protein